MMTDSFKKLLILVPFRHKLMAKQNRLNLVNVKLLFVNTKILTFIDHAFYSSKIPKNSKLTQE